MNEVEFDVAAAAEELPAALGIRARHVGAALEDGKVGWEEGVTGGAHKLEDFLLRPRAGFVCSVREALVWRIAEVVEEEPADAACLAAVRDEEILVTPGLEAGIKRHAVHVACGFERRVEVLRVVLVEKRRGEVGPAAEPPREHFVLVFRVCDFEEAIIGVHCWRVRIARVDDEGETSGEEGEVLLLVGIVGQ